MLRDRLAPHAVAGAITAIILAPLAKSGYVLSYDMNFVPDQPMRLDLLAPIDSAPRAVPLDAAVSLLNLAIPGWLLQRLVLAAIIWVAFVGAARLVPTERLSVRLLAGVVYTWSPFLAERLLLGQWALLVTYAALPWLILAALRFRAGDWAALPPLALAAGLSALTPTGGLLAAVIGVVMVIGLPWQRWLAVMATLAVLNSPWVVASLTAPGAHSDPSGVAAFAARSENWAGAFVALLGTGGLWNKDTTPASRSSPLVPLVTLFLLFLAFAGYRAVARKIGGRPIIVALAGLVIAALSTVPGGQSALEWLVGNVPGAGLLRDSQKFVLPYALALALCVAVGVERLTDRLPREAARVVLIGMPLMVLVSLPDLAFGGLGALRPVGYPADWLEVNRVVSADPGLMLSLPLSEYRTYPWNGGRVVLDPAPRYFDVPVLADDTLVVGDLAVQGENVRLEPVRAWLAGKSQIPTDVRWVLVQHRGRADVVPAERLEGLQRVLDGSDLALYRNPAAIPSNVDLGRRLPVIAAEIAALLLLISAGLTMAARRRR